MISQEKILERLDEQEERINYLEQVVGVDNYESQDIDDLPDSDEEKTVIKEKNKFTSFSFNQVITFLGLTGIIIGLISFFFYAIANNWIGKSAQIILGMSLGFLLFGFAYKLREKKEDWSNIVFGGSYFIEYLSIGIGVLEYRVLPEFFGILVCLLFLVSSLLLSIKFNSRIIAHFSLVGGYLIPFITGSFTNDLFVMSFYALLSLALVVFSFKKDFFDVRFISYIFMSFFFLISSQSLISASNKIIPVLFLLLIYLLFNISSLIGSFKKNTVSISSLDAFILGSQPILFLLILFFMFSWTTEVFGVFVMIFSFLYLGEYLFIKSKNESLSDFIKYTLISTALITINLGIIFLLDSLNIDILFILFIVEWFLFSLFSNKIGENLFFQVCSYIFLGLMVFWYLAFLRFDQGIIHASVYMVVLISVVYGFYSLFKKSINPIFNGPAIIISGFILIFSFHKYLYFFNINGALAQIILSILWLIYTLALLSKILSKNGRLLIGMLLGLTLLKIAFNDLFYLSGGFRIIGFILFGVLLLIGGYYIKNEEK